MAHQSDRPALSLGRFGIGKEQCAVLRGGGLAGSGFRDNAASRPLLTLACGSYSAAAGRSDGYKQGSAFFVMTPFRHNVFSTDG